MLHCTILLARMQLSPPPSSFGVDFSPGSKAFGLFFFLGQALLFLAGEPGGRLGALTQGHCPNQWRSCPQDDSVGRTPCSLDGEDAWPRRMPEREDRVAIAIAGARTCSKSGDPGRMGEHARNWLTPMTEARSA